MWGLTTKLEQFPAWEFTTYPGELEADGSSVSLAPPVGSKPQSEHQGEVYEEEGHLYDCITMLYEEDFLEPVLIQGMPLHL